VYAGQNGAFIFLAASLDGKLVVDKMADYQRDPMLNSAAEWCTYLICCIVPHQVLYTTGIPLYRKSKYGYRTRMLGRHAYHLIIRFQFHSGMPQRSQDASDSLQGNFIVYRISKS
jgi:hypothetical protein